MLDLIVTFVADDQSKWETTIHEGEMALWAGLTYLQFFPLWGN